MIAVFDVLQGGGKDRFGKSWGGKVKLSVKLGKTGGGGG
jgi:hypothetical protein